jgi:hypothetical protein
VCWVLASDGPTISHLALLLPDCSELWLTCMFLWKSKYLEFSHQAQPCFETSGPAPAPGIMIRVLGILATTIVQIVTVTPKLLVLKQSQRDENEITAFWHTRGCFPQVQWKSISEVSQLKSNSPWKEDKFSGWGIRYQHEGLRKWEETGTVCVCMLQSFNSKAFVLLLRGSKQTDLRPKGREGKERRKESNTNVSQRNMRQACGNSSSQVYSILLGWIYTN